MHILPSLAWSKPSFAHLTIIEKLHQLNYEYSDGYAGQIDSNQSIILSAYQKKGHGFYEIPCIVYNNV